MTSKIEKLEKLLADSKDNWSSPELYNTALAMIEIVKAAKALDTGHHSLCNAGLRGGHQKCSCGLEDLLDALDKFEEVEL